MAQKATPGYAAKTSRVNVSDGTSNPRHRTHAESPASDAFTVGERVYNRLAKYREKRDFHKTDEPQGEEKMSDGRVYVVQKHAATHLHYDLRLEMDGVLKSWAVPKTPPTEPGVRRLAVEVEDHPIEYATFEGSIPTGEYGAGTVEIWDKGSYMLLERKEDKITVEIHGEKLRGIYFLVRFKDKRNWLFFKKKP
jgi:DNA ligase D-like protein (predicted 3'-phosphoesterase)